MFDMICFTRGALKAWLPNEKYCKHQLFTKIICYELQGRFFRLFCCETLGTECLVSAAQKQVWKLVDFRGEPDPEETECDAKSH